MHFMLSSQTFIDDAQMQNTLNSLIWCEILAREREREIEEVYAVENEEIAYFTLSKIINFKTKLLHSSPIFVSAEHPTQSI